MNSQKKNQEDLLRQYINPEKIEKAPEGFTSKVMTRIQIETVPLKAAGRLRNISFVPVISVSVTILLILAAVIIPGSKTGSSVFPAADLIKNIKVYLPEIDLTFIFRFNLPALIMYLFIGILLLTIFDRALNMLFHRGK